jgi:hypothetical protein
MALFIRHDRIRSGIPPASPPALPVDQRAQPRESLDGDARPALDDHGPAAGLVEHPARDHESQILLTLHDDSGFPAGPQAANHPDFLPMERVESVFDPRRAELMSSVSMCCDTVSRLTC